MGLENNSTQNFINLTILTVFMKVTIIGSFRKFYKEICEIYDLFEKEGIITLSPKKSRILDPKKEFVILASDPKRAIIKEIENKVLDSILHSDFVYFLNPKGYVGLTAAFEIGYTKALKKCLYSSEMITDPLLREYVDGIYSPRELVNYLKSKAN